MWINSKCQGPNKAKLYNTRTLAESCQAAGSSGLTKMPHLQSIIAHFLHLTSCPSLSSDPLGLNLPSVLMICHSKIKTLAFCPLIKVNLTALWMSPFKIVL